MKRAAHSFIAWLALAVATTLGLAASLALAKTNQDFLEPEQAFRVSAKVVDARTLGVNIQVAEGYYLYREKFAFAALPVSVSLGEPELPKGKIKFDQTFNKDVESYRGVLSFALPVNGVADAAGRALVTVTSQGCADAGLCYPPMESHFELTGLGGPAAAMKVRALTDAQAQAWAGGGSGTNLLGGPAALSGASKAGVLREDQGMEAVLRSQRLPLIIGAFFLAGLLLSFTPCVLPMLPILSSVIVGPTMGAAVSRRLGFTLALAYSLGMSLVYTLMGVAAGLAGEGLAAALQNAWVLGAFAALLVLMSLSMFGVYELQLPASWQTRVSIFSQRLPGGSHGGVFLMGALSALIVGPCVAAPLAGALVYISQSRDAVLGATALFAMAMGMSVPMLLLGASAGALLPRVGPWMESIKRLFGWLLLGVALWIVSPVLPTMAQMLLWAAWLVAAGVALRGTDRLPDGASGLERAGKALGVLALLLGAAQLVGALSGGSDVLRPLAHLRASADAGAAVAGKPAFRIVKTNAELDAALAQPGRPVMLDFWAEWCVSCKEMERFTFTDPRVAQRMGQAVLLKIDVTANTADDKALLKRFGLFGPPGTVFFDAAGRELPGVRVIGFQNADTFLGSLSAAGL